MTEFTAKQLEELGKEIASTFHLLEVNGKYMTEAGMVSIGEVGLMASTLVAIATLKAD